MKRMLVFTFLFTLYTAFIQAQEVSVSRPQIHAVAVDASGVESPLTVLGISVCLRQLIHILPPIVPMEQAGYALHRSLVSFTPQQAGVFSPERLGRFTTTEVYGHILNIVGYRMKTQPTEALTLLDADAAGKRASLVRDYLHSVWGIAPERLPFKQTATVGTMPPRVELSGADVLLEPLVLKFDTVREASAPTIRFFSTVTESATPTQWGIEITQGGRMLKSIRSTGKVRPSMDWRLNIEPSSLPVQRSKQPRDSLRYRLEVRYENIENQQSNIGTIPLDFRPCLGQKKCSATLLFSPTDDKKLPAQTASILDRLKREGWLQFSSKITLKSYASVADTPDTERKRIAERRANAVLAALGVGNGGSNRAHVSVEASPSAAPFRALPLELMTLFENVLMLDIENP
jgi:hypothetical protein